MITLYPYQEKAIEDVDREVARGRKRNLVVAPTGAGKTVMFSECIRRARANRQNVLVFAHRKEIIAQISQTLHANEIPHGIIQAEKPELERPFELVQVASKDTLHARAFRRKKTARMELPKADLVIVDEAHHCPANSYREIIGAYPDAVLLGFTATPCRSDGCGLGDIFDVLIECPQVPELIKLEKLVPTIVYGPEKSPDLAGVHVRAGDYVEKELADRMNMPKLVGDVVTHWLKFGERRRTVCFAVNVQHSIALREEFIAHGVRAEHIDGKTLKDERDATLARLASGEIEVVCNCMVLTEGWDCPPVSCCILARPTKKMGLYRQMIGRVLRPASSKKDAIIIDHAGATDRHGWVDEHVEWTLHTARGATNPKHEERQADKFGNRVCECSKCGALRMGGEPCKACGFFPQRPAKPVAVIDGELGLMSRDRKVTPAQYTDADRLRWLGMLTAIAQERGWNPKSARANYHDKFGSWPPYGLVAEPITPTPECRAWVRSKLIAFYKSRGAA